MNKWDLFKGIEGIDDDILERSEGMTDSALSEKIAIKKDNTEKEGKTLKEDKTQKLKKYIILRKWTTAAACICLLVGGIAFGLSAVKGSVPGDDFWDSVQGAESTDRAAELSGGDILAENSQAEEVPSGTQNQEGAERAEETGNLSESDNQEGPEYRWEVVYNEISVRAAQDATWTDAFIEELDDNELDAVMPGKWIEWMEFSGCAAFTQEGKVLDVILNVTTTVPGREVLAAMGEELILVDYVYLQEPVISEINGTEYRAYQYRDSVSGVVTLEAYSERGGIRYAFIMQHIPENELERAKADFYDILECFSYKTPDLSRIAAEGIPEREDKAQGE